MVDMDEAIVKSSPSMPNACPFMENIFLEKIELNLQDESSFMGTGKIIYSSIRSGFRTDIAHSRKLISAPDFWESLFHLMGSGSVVGDYGQNLSVLLLKVQSAILGNLQKILGKRVAQLYQDCLSQAMDEQWPNFPEHKNYDRIYGAYDRIYGTAPYRTWTRLLGESITKATSTAMGHACYKKALASLNPEENIILQQLLD